MYLGDFRRGDVVRFLWNTNAATGGSITRGTNGTVRIYKDGGATEWAGAVTDTEDFDGLTGVHLAAIDLSSDAAFFTPGSDYFAVLAGATIDGQSVNAQIRMFSIDNRDSRIVSRGQIGGSANVSGAAYDVTLPAGQRAAVAVGMELHVYGKGYAYITAYNSTTGVARVDTTGWVSVPATSDFYKVTGLPQALVQTSAAIDSTFISAVQSGLATATALATAQAGITTIAGYLDTEVASILSIVSALPSAIQNADALLARNIAGGSNGGRTVGSAVAVLRNRVVIDGSSVTVYATDDTTVLWSGTVVRTGGLNPLQTIDPA